MKRFVMIVVPLLLSIGTARAADTDPAAVPSGGDQQIAGKRLMLKDSHAAAKGSLSSLSNDRRITLGGGNGSADDPTLFGGSLRVRTATGDRFDSRRPTSTPSRRRARSRTTARCTSPSA